MKIENDYLNNGVTDSRDPNFRWNAPCGTLPDHHSLATADIQRRQKIQQAHDDKLREQLAAAEAAKGRPLSFTEREIVRLS